MRLEVAVVALADDLGATLERDAPRQQVHHATADAVVVHHDAAPCHLVLRRQPLDDLGTLHHAGPWQHDGVHHGKPMPQQHHRAVAAVACYVGGDAGVAVVHHVGEEVGEGVVVHQGRRVVVVVPVAEEEALAVGAGEALEVVDVVGADVLVVGDQRRHEGAVRLQHALAPRLVEVREDPVAGGVARQQHLRPQTKLV